MSLGEAMHDDFAFTVSKYMLDSNAKMTHPRDSVSRSNPQTFSPETSPPLGGPNPRETRSAPKRHAEGIEPAVMGMQTVFSSQTGEAHPSQQHPAHVWESHKEEIRRLYLDENRPLKDVMARMRQKGFRAT